MAREESQYAVELEVKPIPESSTYYLAVSSGLNFRTSSKSIQLFIEILTSFRAHMLFGDRIPELLTREFEFPFTPINNSSSMSDAASETFSLAIPVRNYQAIDLIRYEMDIHASIHFFLNLLMTRHQLLLTRSKAKIMNFLLSESYFRRHPDSSTIQNNEQADDTTLLPTQLSQLPADILKIILGFAFGSRPAPPDAFVVMIKPLVNQYDSSVFCNAGLGGLPIDRQRKLLSDAVRHMVSMTTQLPDNPFIIQMHEFESKEEKLKVAGGVMPFDLSKMHNAQKGLLTIINQRGHPFFSVDASRLFDYATISIPNDDVEEHECHSLRFSPLLAEEKKGEEESSQSDFCLIL